MKQWRILQMVSILADDRSIKLSKFARSRITPPINTLVDMDKKLPLSPFRENARKCGTKWYLKTKAEEKSKAEVSVGEYWPRNHLPRVAISSCPFGICFKYNFVFWLLWIKYMTCVLILLWRLFIELEIRLKRIM